MSEAPEQDSDNNEEQEASGPVGGERLRAAREEQQVSILEIGKELHLDEQKVRALEDNQFESLGAPVFAKGHLRKYAQLVGLDEREVLGDYHELTRSAGMPPVVGKRKRVTSELSPGPWIIVVLALIVAAFAYWWFTSGRELTSGSSLAPPIEPAAFDAPAGDVADDPAPAPMDSPATDGGSEEEPAPADTDDADDTNDTDDAAPAESAVPEPSTAEAADIAPATSPPAEPGQVTLSLAFTEDCWTEVSDSSGDRLFFNLGRAGSSVTVSGTPPLSVLLGSADGVTVTVDGRDYPISNADRRGRTARLTLP